MAPNRKAKITPTFCLVAICNLRIAGIGIDRTRVSVSTSDIAYASQTTILFTHVEDVIVKSQTASTGVHWKANAKKKAPCQTSTIDPMIQDASLNEELTKIRR